jgi:hypothetical protein
VLKKHRVRKLLSCLAFDLVSLGGKQKQRESGREFVGIV